MRLDRVSERAVARVYLMIDEYFVEIDGFGNTIVESTWSTKREARARAAKLNRLFREGFK